MTDLKFIKAPEPNGKITGELIADLSILFLEKIITSIEPMTGRQLVFVDHGRGDMSLIILEHEFGIDRCWLICRRQFTSGKPPMVLTTAEFWRVDLESSRLEDLGNRLRSEGERINVVWGSPEFKKWIDDYFIRSYLDWALLEAC